MIEVVQRQPTAQVILFDLFSQQTQAFAEDIANGKNSLVIAAEHAVSSVRCIFQAMLTLNVEQQQLIWRQARDYFKRYPSSNAATNLFYAAQPEDLATGSACYTDILAACDGRLSNDSVILTRAVERSPELAKCAFEAMYYLSAQRQNDIWCQTKDDLSARVNYTTILGLIKAMDPRNITRNSRYLQELPFAGASEDEASEITVALYELVMEEVKLHLVDKFDRLKDTDARYQRAYNVSSALYTSLSQSLQRYNEACPEDKAYELANLKRDWLEQAKPENMQELTYHRQAIGLALECIATIVLIMTGIGALYLLGQKAYDVHAGYGLFRPLIPTQSTQNLHQTFKQMTAAPG